MMQRSFADHADHADRIAIFHLSMNACGGAEILSLTLSKALHEQGFRVHLVTTEKSNWPRINCMLGISNESVDREYVIPPFVTLPTIYSRCFNWVCRDAVFVPLLRKKYDLTITTMQTFPVVFSDIIYMHFTDFGPNYLSQVSGKYSQGIMRAYSLSFKGLCELFVRTYKGLSIKPMVITNSRFSKREIKRVLDIESHVVYPPVDTSKWRRLTTNGKKSNIVLTISRLEESKNLDVLPRLVKLVPHAKFIVIGSADQKSTSYVDTIISEAKRLGVSNRLAIMKNCGEAEKKEALAQAKVYLHTMRNEHFGISIVEGMSAGLVPVVHKSGGPWIDILEREQGRYGYAYESIGEAANTITEILGRDRLRAELSERAQERANFFSTQSFSSNMLSIIRRAITLRRQRTNSYDRAVGSILT